MTNQYNVAQEFVNFYWDSTVSFWDWISEGPGVDAMQEYEENGSINDFVDHLDGCMTAIIESGDDDVYTEEESEFLDDTPYDTVDLKHNYEFLNDLKTWYKDCDNTKFLEDLEKLLLMAKLKEA